MPELPEVEYVRRFLARAMRGARIERVTLRRTGLRIPFSADFRRRLEGQTVQAIDRRAKYLLVTVSSGDVLVIHLGMSGWFRVTGRGGHRDRASPPDGGSHGKHDHVVFELSNGATIVFNDPRRFGFMKVLDRSGAAADAALSALGPEPLGRAFSATVLANALAGRKTPIKTALLDQRRIAGLGNIYACEALHAARLSPRRGAATLVTRAGSPTPQLEVLVAAIRAVLKDAIANRHRAGGDDRFRVYGHEGERCPRRGCGGTIKRIVQAGRSTFFCPVCQG